MIFDEVKPITRSEAEAGLESGVPDKICDALVRMTYHDPDWRWVQEVCLALTRQSNLEVSGLAVTCLGHLARIHHALDVDRVLPRLRSLQENPSLAGRVNDAFDDIKTYLKCDFKLE